MRGSDVSKVVKISVLTFGFMGLIFYFFGEMAI